MLSSTNDTGANIKQGRGAASSQTDQKTERSSNRRQPRSSRDDRVEPKLAEGGKPIENKVAQGEDGGRPRRRSRWKAAT